MAEPQFWGLEDNWLTVVTTAATAARLLEPITQRSKRREHRFALQPIFIHPPTPTQQQFAVPYLLVPIAQPHRKRREHRVVPTTLSVGHSSPLRLPVPRLLIPLEIPKSKHRTEKRERPPVLFQAHGGPLRLPVPRLLVPLEIPKSKHRTERRERQPILFPSHGGPLALPIPRLLVPIENKTKHKIEKRQRQPWLGQSHGGPLAQPVPRLIVPLEIPRSKRRMHRVVPSRFTMPPPPTVTPFFIPYALRPAYIENRRHHRTRDGHRIRPFFIQAPIPNPPPQIGPSYGGYPWWSPFWMPDEDVRRRMLAYGNEAPDIRNLPMSFVPVQVRQPRPIVQARLRHRVQAHVSVAAGPVEQIYPAQPTSVRHEWVVINKAARRRRAETELVILDVLSSR